MIVLGRPHTNYDRVKKMTLEEIAGLLNGIAEYCPKYRAGSVYCDKLDCKGCIEKWLRSPVREEK